MPRKSAEYSVENKSLISPLTIPNENSYHKTLLTIAVFAIFVVVVVRRASEALLPMKSGANAILSYHKFCSKATTYTPYLHTHTTIHDESERKKPTNLENKFDGVLFSAGDEINFGIKADRRRRRRRKKTHEIKRRQFERRNMAKFCDDTNKVGLP